MTTQNILGADSSEKSALINYSVQQYILDDNIFLKIISFYGEKIINIQWEKYYRRYPQLGTVYIVRITYTGFSIAST
jgi:hypothetical protein